jgi:Glycosyl transferase 4-like domain
MPRVLVVSWHVPPQPDSGAVRVGGFLQHLPSRGWDPIVVTGPVPRGDEALQTWGVPVPEAPLIQVPSGPDRPLVHARWVVPRRLARECFWLPDKSIAWYRPASATAVEVGERHRVDAVLSSGPPHTCHVIAATAARRLNVPWIADLRDLWTDNAAYLWVAPRHLADALLERRVLRSASVLVTTSAPSAAVLRRRHPHHRVVPVATGVDERLVATGPPPSSERFDLVFTGQLYPPHQDVRVLGQALLAFLGRRAAAEHVRVRFFGDETDVRPAVETAATELGLSDTMKWEAQRSRLESLEVQRRAQVLVLLGWLDGRHRELVPGKLFEYLAARRPILSVGGAPAEPAALIERAGAGIHVADADQAGAWLAECYDDWRAHGATRRPTNPPTPWPTQREMAAHLGELLDELCTPG